MKKIAFMFLTYDNLNQPKVWENFFQNADPNLYSIYCHPKWQNKVTQPFLKKHIIQKHTETEWCSIDIVKADILLMEEAFKDIDNYKAVIISNSCVPLHDFNYTYNYLTRDEIGYIGIMLSDPKKIKYEYGWSWDLSIATMHWNNVKNLMPLENFVKHRHEGQCFSRNMMKLFLENDFTDSFKNLSCAEEHYFGSVLFHLNYRNMINEKNLTFANWKEGSPKTYNSVTKEEIKKIKDEGHLFFRKVSTDFDYNKYLENI